MINSDIEILLGQAMGLKVTSISETSINNAVHRRMNAIGLASIREYVRKLKRSPQELNELVEEVVIPETWFFRDRVPFVALVDFVFNTWSLDDNKKTLRILSVPCSTGEEPYSICMALTQAGWPPDQFRVDAIDISSRSIARAKEAIYSKNSFRGEDLQFRERFFKKTGKKYTLKSFIKKTVHFHHGNILNPNFIHKFGQFDIIFCRNILIYLDAACQENTIKLLHGILDPKGLFFTGHSEAGLFTSSGIFTSFPCPGAFAFVKKGHLSSLFPQTASVKSVSKNQQPAMPSESHVADLELAKDLVNKGHLVEALKICNDHLRTYGPTAQSNFLLGLIHFVEGKFDEALNLLRKTVYLEPDHSEALTLLSLLAENAGDMTAAGNFKRRAQQAWEK